MLHLSFQWFWCEFIRHADNSGLVYTPRQHVVFSYKLSKFSPQAPKYNNLKKVYAFEFSKQVQLRRQNGTLQKAKLISVNKQQKKNQDYHIKKVVKRP